MLLILLKDMSHGVLNLSVAATEGHFNSIHFR